MYPLFFLPFFIVLSSCSAVGVRTTQELDYQVIKVYGEYELRKYNDYKVVQTTAGGSYEQASSKNFRKLFKYITGNNQSEADISMTAPVKLQSVTIDMTAPVQIQSVEDRGGEGRYSMQFVLPSEYQGENAKKAPLALDPSVTLSVVPASRVAVKRFSGILSEKAVASQENLLRDWIRQEGLTPLGRVSSAGFDPPWTIPFFRRNEVMFRVEINSGEGEKQREE